MASRGFKSLTSCGPRICLHEFQYSHIPFKFDSLVNFKRFYFCVTLTVYFPKGTIFQIQFF